ncbi:MAG TPA: tetratricopeptide repeat protein [Anaeromyxobacter sp.]|jgi:Flp pilus assembly protein TadD|nr:tetratricopeptide repeat protein [Anaeromyxobacter sp.]
MDEGAAPAALAPDGRRAGIAAALAAGAFALYAQTAGSGFIHFDDNRYLTQNPMVQGGLSWAGVAWAFTTFHASNWHPLAWLSHMLDVQLFGMSPGAHHLVNAALHAVNTALLFWLLARATGATWRSALVAALFAVHPLHVESVAWVAERKDVLSTAFGLGALHAYVSWARRPSARAAAAVLGLYALSLLAKSMWVTFPAVLLLLDVWPLGRVEGVPGVTPAPGAPFGRVRPGRALAEKVPLAVLAVVSSALTIVAQHRGGTIAGLDLGLGARLANAGVAYVAYLAKTVWPWPLAVLYPFRVGGIPAWQAVATWAFLAAATAVALRARARAPWLAVGWLWFLGTLVPVIGIVQVGAQAYADRYTYWPLVGIFVAAVWSGHELLARRGVPARAAAALGGAVLVALAVVTSIQLGFWRSHEALFRHTIAVTESNGLAYGALSEGLRADGRQVEAIAASEEAVRLNPNDARLWNNLGVTLREAGRLEDAKASLSRALAVNPEHAGAWRNLGDVLVDQGDRDGASAAFERATQIAPQDGEAWARLGGVAMRGGDSARAIDAYQRAVAVLPSHFTAWTNLAVLYQSTGRVPEARHAFETAAALRPGSFVALRNLGVFQTKTGDLAAAISAFRQALRIQPGDVDVLHRLGVANAMLGIRPEALAIAAQLDPVDSGAAADIRARLPPEP